MIEPVEKKKKKRRRSARVYVNANKPLAVPLDEIAAHFPADEDDDDQPTPAHAEARARTRAMAKPDTGKRDAGQPGLPAADVRVSPSRVTGQAAASTGDHGAAMAPDPMCQPGPRELAFRHPDLRSGSTTIAPWVTLRTRQGDNQNGDRDITYVPGQVGLDSLAAAGAAGVPRPAYNPASRPLDHVARNSGTPPNGSHGLANPVSTPRPAMKNSDLRAEFKRMLFPGSSAR